MEEDRRNETNPEDADFDECLARYYKEVVKTSAYYVDEVSQFLERYDKKLIADLLRYDETLVEDLIRMETEDYRQWYGDHVQDYDEEIDDEEWAEIIASERRGRIREARDNKRRYFEKKERDRKQRRYDEADFMKMGWYALKLFVIFLVIFMLFLSLGEIVSGSFF